MIYILSFLRRLKFKTSFYFSFLISLIVLLFTFDLSIAVSTLFISIVSLLTLSHLINFIDKKRTTNINCVICGFEHCTILYPARRKKGNKVKGDFACSSFDHGQYSDIYYCPECKNGFLKEVVENLNKDFEIYESVEDEKYIENIDARFMTNSKLVEKYLPDFKDKNVLEIGSYYGAFLNEVIKVCKSYQGVEPSKHACNYVRNKYENISVYQGDLESYLKENSDKKFDTIVLWDVIEHVPRPIELLKMINSLLKENGRVLFSTINVESSFSLALGPYWPWYMDMHYYYFSDRGYVDILHRSGFVLKEHSHFSYYVHAVYFVEKVFSILFGSTKLLSPFKNILKFPIKIKFGDTVLVAGTKL